MVKEIDFTGVDALLKSMDCSDWKSFAQCAGATESKKHV